MQYRHHNLKTPITRPAIRAFLLSAAVYIAAFTYCSYAFWRDPHSAFFKSDHVYDLKYSASRQADGLELVKAANSSEGATNILKAGENPALCAVFTPFISIFEDDIVFAEGWMTRTLLALATLKFGNPRKVLPQRSWLYLRLFYTETSATMWKDTDFWYSNIWLTIVIAVLVGFFLLLQLRRYWPPSRPYLDNSTVAVLTFVTIPAFVILIFMVGKFNLFPPAPGPFLMNESGCCTQQHVGLVSSRDNTFVNAQSTWAFWFENFDSGELRRWHTKNVRKIPWVRLKGD